MSTQRGPWVKYSCLNDCAQTGCPGHRIRAVYFHTSDVMGFEVEGDQNTRYLFDPQEWVAMREAASTDIGSEDI